MSSVTVSVKRPRKYTKELLIFLGGGAIAGLVTTGLHVVAGGAVPALAALSFGGTVGLMANLTDPKAGTPMLRLVLAILGGAALAIITPWHWIPAAALAGILIGLAFSLEDGDSPLERVGFTAVYGAAMTAAVFTTQILAPMIGVALFENIFVGVAWGAFLAFAGGLKRVDWLRDELMSEFNDAHAELRGEEKETVANGRVLYEQILKELERTQDKTLKDRAVSISGESSRALIALARRAQELSVAAERTSGRQVQSRVIQLDARIQKTEDPTVRRELQAALDELVEQVRVRKRFDVARARLEARQQRCFTALERLHVSLIQSTSGADDSAVRESIESLEKLSEEIRWRNLSVDELVGDDAPMDDEETEDIVQMLRESMSDEEISEAQDDAADEEAEQGTVLDTGAVADEGEGDEGPPGTDGHVSVGGDSEASTEEPAHAEAQSRSW